MRKPDDRTDRRSSTWATALFLFATVAHASIPSEAVGQQSATEAASTTSAYDSDMSLPSAERDMKEVASSVAPGIHVFRAPLAYGPAPLANETLIEQRDGLVLVDAGKTRGAGLRIVALIRRISTKPVKAVIITHWHQDHVLGLGPIIEAWPHAAIISSASTRDHLLSEESYKGSPRGPGETAARDQSRTAALKQYAAQYGPSLHDPKNSPEERRGWADVLGVLNLRIADEQGTYLVLPTVTFTDKYLLDDPENPVEAIALGAAHTNGDIVAWAPRQRVVAAGDMIVAPVPYGGTNVLDWPTTLTKLERLQPKVIVPGHGPVERDERYIARMIAALSEMRVKAARLPAAPLLTDEQVMAKLDFAVMRTRFARNDRWLGYWFDQYFAPNAATAYEELHPQKAP